MTGPHQRPHQCGHRDGIVDSQTYVGDAELEGGVLVSWAYVPVDPGRAVDGLALEQGVDESVVLGA